MRIHWSLKIWFFLNQLHLAELRHSSLNGTSTMMLSIFDAVGKYKALDWRHRQVWQSTLCMLTVHLKSCNFFIFFPYYGQQPEVVRYYDQWQHPDNLLLIYLHSISLLFKYHDDYVKTFVSFRVRTVIGQVCCQLKQTWYYISIQFKVT